MKPPKNDVKIPINKVKPNPFQPRTVFNNIEGLAKSIEKEGLNRRIELRKTSGGWEIIDGDRRIRALKFLKRKFLKPVEYEIKQINNEQMLMAIGLSNTNENLNYLEEGRYFCDLIEKVNKIKNDGDVADVVSASQKIVNMKKNIWINLYPRVRDFLFGNISKNDGNISNDSRNITKVPFTHSYEISKLNHNIIVVSQERVDGTTIKKKIFDIIEEIFLDKNLQQEQKEQFQKICEETQLNLCNEIIDRDLKFKHLKARVKNEKENIISRLEDVISVERAKKCWYMKKGNFYSIIYNKDSRLLLNDYSSDVEVFDPKSKKFGRVDMVITSPPYLFFGKEYETAESKDKYLHSLLFKVFENCIIVLKPGGKFVVNIQQKFKHRVMEDIIQFFERKGMEYFGRIIWEKGLTFVNHPLVRFNDKHGEYRHLFNSEFILVFRKPGKVDSEKIKKYETLSRKTFRKKEWLEFVNSVWRIQPVKSMKKVGHPAAFPVELPKRCINAWTFYNDVVLDPFAGISSTGLACQQLHRHYIGYEISKDYFEKGKKRLKSKG